MMSEIYIFYTLKTRYYF